ncbi:PEGA domain protein [Pseudodesulfovibrio mercurii]|uniref:PEGA domain protein n=1 Tax=Pseudodesulfovibrio mercurii TaxID=641491 RepID=F0JE81_9BACT|nr:PEGA domain-containing protein [Pseudodesulfovibrio mercurii]EGB14690.1 PEGA domain protein [Pseudodesulfovibrio mercurii]
MKPLYLAFLACLLLSACSAATQNIPVSSNPDGAQVLADGQAVGTTPCNVTLEKTQPHILTVKKDGYRQVDVQITRKYDTAGVTRDAAQTGLWQSSNGADTEGAVANALMSVGAEEESGDAYVLSPASVVVRLEPVNGQPAVAQADAPVVISSDQLDPADQKRLEESRTGDVSTTEPATLGSAVADDPAKEAEAVLEGAAVAAPTVGTDKEWGSSHTSTSHNSDGSYTQTTTSTKASVGVHVNPVEAGLEAIKLLEGAEGSSSQSAE